jgi:putative lipoprotein
MLLAACASSGSHPQTEAAPANTYLYTCEGLTFTASFDREKATVFLEGRTLELPHVPSASGAKYSDGTNTVWSKGNDAIVEIDGKSYQGCTGELQPGKAG